MIIISAMSEDRVIGSGDGMPWSVPDEYQRYLETVAGQTVIMGRRSWDIFGKDLADTKNIVLTRQPEIDGAKVATSLELALGMAVGAGRMVFVAGGSSVYGQAISIADEMYLSTIKGDFDGDSYFPDFDKSHWDVIREIDYGSYIFRHYSRTS